MKKFYEEAEIEIVKFTGNDVIRTSGCPDDTSSCTTENTCGFED